MEQMEDNRNKANIISSRTYFLSNPSKEEGGDVVIQSSQIHLSSPVEDQIQVKPWSQPLLEEWKKELAIELYSMSLQLLASAIPPAIQHLKEIEVYKTRCLQKILERKGEQSKDRCVKAMNLERARRWYSPSLSNDIEDKFGRMILLDWCFIVELLSGKILELEEARIQFMNSFEESDVKSLFDISFTEATMKIPTFVVEDYTKCLFRNLIAYELYEEGSTYVIDYVTLMDNFINSVKDVQSLHFQGILENIG
ncbi:Uncharacterized protein TCM_032644 [Theobroma cacao]|uniref:Uncharacterized protein n=1 Tax=Theobroma cacao TaxID=3641 RepID=A0A061F977_THECC|nr:Uncharacterized protein TCM_032644 [Theobroma cacao]